LAAWRSFGGSLSFTDAETKRGDFIPNPDPGKIADFQEVRAGSTTDSIVLVNTLSASSFKQEAIPGSVNIPYTATYEDRNSHSLLEPEQLQELFREAAIYLDQEVITYCGIGYTASQLYFVARLLGYSKVRLYDGSLMDWRARGGALKPGRVKAKRTGR
jgi:thiosulfate/3-mercaptopyruvate sulfurtransferase